MESKKGKMTDSTRCLLMSIRQALIMAIGAIEDFLEIQRSIVPRHKRKVSSRLQSPPGFEGDARELVRRQLSGE